MKHHRKTATLAVAFALSVTACATQSPNQYYRARGESQTWEIRGEINELTNLLTVRFNGQEAVSGRLSFLTGAGELRGQYQGHAVAAQLLRRPTVPLEEPPL